MTEPSGEPQPSASPFRRALGRVIHDKVAILATGWIVVVAIVSFVGIWWTPHPPNAQSIDEPFSGISGTTLLGTDDLGRDVLSRLMAGAGVSLRVSFIVVVATLVLAVPIGLISGYRAGYTDAIVMRILDAMSSVPGIVAALAIVGVLGPGPTNITIALIVILAPALVRLVRAQALTVSTEPYIAASRSVGSRTWWILFMRVFPGIIPALAVQVSLSLGAILTAEAALSFLGLGVQPPNSSWGGILSRSYRNILLDPAGIFPPVIAIGATVLAFNLVGDSLRDALGAGVNRRARRRSKLGITSVVKREPAPVAAESAEVPNGSARLVVENLCVDFETESGVVRALDGVTLHVAPGEVLGLVGESGSGKTVTAMSVMRLLQSPPALIADGSIRFEGRELLELSMRDMREVRGGQIAMVFQNPMTSLDPVYTIGNSMRSAIRSHQPMSRSAANRRAVELLDMVDIPSPARRLNDYPHNFSGGMRQRVMIAMALAGNPRLLIADEPTTALDVTIQAQILDLLKSLGDELGMSMILVTHDLGVIADICDRVTVMYAGHVVETASVESLFAHPGHPYTAGLLGAVPSADATGRRLSSLPGIVPQLDAMPDGCRFAPRCNHAIDACHVAVPGTSVVRDHEVRCIRADDEGLVLP